VVNTICLGIKAFAIVSFCLWEIYAYYYSAVSWLK